MLKLQKKPLAVSLIGAPLYLLLHFDGLIAVPADISAGSMLALRSFGQLPMSDWNSLTDIIGGIAFIILFNILYSGYITSHFRFSCVYVFSRVRSRESWYLQRCAEVLFYAALYSFLYVAAGLLICRHMVVQTITAADMLTALRIWIYSIILLGNTTLLLSLISLKTGTLTGFVVTQVAVFLLIFANLFISAPTVIGLNPVSLLQFKLLTQTQHIGTVTVNGVILAVLLMAGGQYVKRYDVAMFDAEVN